jgi:Starch-binding associating with outer membrane
MKVLKLKNLFAVAIIVMITIISCKKSAYEVNTSTTAVTTSTIEYKTVLPASLAATAAIHGTQWKAIQNWLGYWARSGSYQSIDDEETYSFTNDFPITVNYSGITGANLAWNNLYANATNYDFIAKSAKLNGAGTYEAIARIMKALDFQMLVDVYGNVPYSEAFQGGTIRTPKYDQDESIYADLFKELDASIVLLKGPSSALINNTDIATNDLVFKGNKTNWIKFANTLKLRLLMHMGNTSFAGGTEVNSFVAGANEIAEIAKITAEGSGFLGAGLSAMVNPGYNDTKPNPYYRAFVKDENGTQPGLGDQTKANSYAVGPNGGNPGYYAWNGDPRVNKFYGLSSTGIMRGIPYGQVSNATLYPNNGGNNLSTLNGPGILPNGASSSAWIFTSTESLFLQAEAMRRGLLAGSALTMTNSAITESFVSLGLTSTQAAAYISGNASYPDVDFNGVSQGAGLPAGGMFTILSQKWFALNVFAPLEVWTDYRRANMVYGEGGGFIAGPLISVHPQNTKTAIPIRFFYPQDEYSYNATNVAGEGSVNVFTGGGVSGRNRIFWDKN